jgi:predicted house-cleaning noncanonical NTP pyrophosphatase (MazG superfamily)
MKNIKCFQIEALVRDKMPQRLRKLGGYVGVHYLDPKDLRHHLKLKLKEEVDEVLAATTPKDIKEEIADVLEVLYSLAKTYDFQIDHLEKKRIQKYNERGGFKKGIFAEFVEVEDCDDSHPVVQYCLSNPEKYPEINPSNYFFETSNVDDEMHPEVD